MKTMTVRQLRNLLEGEDDGRPVIFSTDYGDYHRTLQALPLSGDVELVHIERSAYSNSGYALVREEDYDIVDETEVESYLLIR